MPDGSAAAGQAWSPRLRRPRWRIPASAGRRARRKHDDAVGVPRPAATGDCRSKGLPVPPPTSSRFSAPAAKKPMERLSGDQNGNRAPSVPASGCAVVVASDRSHRRDAPSPEATNTICRPSGESANDASLLVAGVTISVRVSGGGVWRRYLTVGMASATITIAAMASAAIQTSRSRLGCDGAGATDVVGEARQGSRPCPARTARSKCPRRAAGDPWPGNCAATCGPAGAHRAGARPSWARGAPPRRALRWCPHRRTGAAPSPSRRARSRTPRCPRVCRPPSRAPAPATCTRPCRESRRRRSSAPAT